MMRQTTTAARWPQGRGFTLVELLVVILIIGLVSAVTLPVVLPALNNRAVNEALRILQASLAGARDSAIRANEPRGIRLLPDPILTQDSLALGANALLPAGTRALAYNRFVAIEPADDYTEGFVSIDNSPNLGAGVFPTFYPGGDPADPSFKNTTCTTPYPYPRLGTGKVLMIEECYYDLKNYNFALGGAPQRNPPTSWYWNIRIGDKIRLSDSGRYYTVVGPMNITPEAFRSDPCSTSTTAVLNPEMFVNIGPPGTVSPLLRNFVDPITGALYASNPEFLFLVNGEDDDGDGYVDEGFNGVDENSNGAIDDLGEWEPEEWLGPHARQAASSPFRNQEYAIVRRPVPVQSSREIVLPGGVVIDATTWNQPKKERSRLPVDANTLYADIMMTPGGQVVPTTQYSTPANYFNQVNGRPFFHFWLTEREGVHQITEIWGTSPATTPSFYLPMPEGTPGYTAFISGGTTVNLTGERRLLTLSTRNGATNTTTLENFDITNFNAPFIDAEAGVQETN